MKKRKVELKSPNFISIVHENSQRHSICLLLLSAIQSVIAPIVCYADEPHPAISDHAVMETGKINFDLSATRPTMPAAKVLGTSTGVTNIKVAGSVVSIAGASLVTPAQALAAYQVSKTGTQNLLVGASGNAVGGAFALNTNFSNLANSLSIPSGVTALATKSDSPIVLSGFIQNAGTILIQSLGNNSSTLSAQSISNLVGGVISNNSGQSGTFSSNLLLSATQSILNEGIIQSIGGLTLSAGNSVTNSGQVLANNTLSIVSSTGQISNSGVLSSANGDINIGVANSLANLNFNNSLGTLQAAAGSINLGNTAFAPANINAIGGSFIAQNVNLVSNGSAVLDAKTVQGLVNVTACEAHINAATANLQLGNITLSGDPSFYNTAGDLTINGSITTAGNPLALIARGNIYATSAASIDTSSKTGNGGPITIVAGAEFSSTGPANQNNDTTSTLTITGASQTGGFVDLKGNLSTANKGVSIVSLKSSSENITGNLNNGGDLTIVAFSGTDANSGQVSLPDNLLINTQGHDNGSDLAINGKVSIIAPSAISIGGISSVGGSGGGEVEISNSQALIPGGSLSILNGAILNGGTFTPSATNVHGSIAIKSPVQFSGQVSINGGSFVSSSIAVSSTAKEIGSISIVANSEAPIETGSLSANGNVASNDAGLISVTNNGNGGIKVSGNISANGFDKGGGGLVLLQAVTESDSSVAAGPILISSSNSISADGGTKGSGGSVTLIGSFLDITGSGASISSRGPGLNGGSITIFSSATGSSIVVGLNEGNISLDTQSANGAGSVQIASMGNLQINPSALATGPTVSGEGDSLSFTSVAGTVLVTGDLSSNGKSATGSGGKIEINSNSSQLFEMGNLATTNGVRGALSASGSDDGGAIIINNLGSGGIKLFSQSDITVANGADGSGGSIVLNARGESGTGGTLTIPAGSYSVDANGTAEFGGLIIFSAEKLAMTGGSSISLSANSPQGAGGVVQVALFDPGANLVVGSTGQITQISATGGSHGGVVQVLAGDNLTLQNQSDISVANGPNGSGGVLQLIASGGDLSVPAGTYNMDAKGSGAFGGAISLRGDTIALTGGSSLVLSANAAQGAGGYLEIVSRNATTNLNIGAGGFVSQLSAAGGTGDGGIIFVQSGGNLTLDAQASASVANGANGSGGSLSLVSAGTLSLPSGAYVVDAQGKGVRGGTLLFSASDIVLTGGSSISLSANAALGSGGAVTLVEKTAANSLVIGASGLVTQISVNGTDGAAGKVFLVSGGDLTVDSSAVATSSGGSGEAHGAFITYASGAAGLTTADIIESAWYQIPNFVDPGSRFLNGTGVLPDSAFTSAGNTQVSAAINVSGKGIGSGGSIYIYSNSATAFDVGSFGASSNKSGLLSANAGPGGGNGGTISVINFGTGGIQLLQNLIVTASSTGNGGNIVLGSIAGTAGPLNIAPAVTMLSVDAGDTGEGGGSIAVAGSSLIHPNAQLIFSANSCCNSTGLISLTTTDASSDLVIGSDVDNLRFITNRGTVSVTAGRNLTVDPTGISANDITLKAGYDTNSGRLILDGSAICCFGSTNLSANGDIEIHNAIEADSVEILANNSGSITFFDSVSATLSSLKIAAEGDVNGSFLNTATLRGVSEITLAAGVEAIGGDINDLQFNGSGGSINLANSSPIALTAPAVNFDLSQANLDATAFFAGTNGGAVNVIADGDINVGYVRSVGGGGPADSGGNIQITSNTGNIVINGEINTSGGFGNLLGGAGLGLMGGNIAIAAPDTSSDIAINGPVVSQSASKTGNVSISGNTLSLNSIFEDYFVDDLGKSAISSGSPLFGQSAFASGSLNIVAKVSGNGSVVSSNLYSANGNFSSTTNSVAVDLITASNPLFTVNTGTFGAITNGSIGGLKSDNLVTFNGIPQGKSVSTTIDINGGAKILENGSVVTITDGQLVSPAEYVALVQLATNGKQTIVLNASGAAVGGQFEIAAANLPAGGFKTLTIPSNVTADVSLPGLTVAPVGAAGKDNDGIVTLNGTLGFSGAFNLSAVSIEGTGTLNGGTGASLTMTAANGNIGTSTQVLSFVADDIKATANGATSSVFLTNPSSGVDVLASSASTVLQISGKGSISTTGNINAPDVRLIALSGSNGSINVESIVGQATGSLTISADGTGSITEGVGKSIDAGTLLLSSGSGSIGTIGTPLNVSASNLSANTTGSVVINNTIPVGSTTLKLLQSSGNPFILTSNSSIAVNGPLTGSGTTLDSTSPAGTLTLNAAVTATGGGTVSLKAAGAISDTPLAVTTGGTLIVNSTNGPVNLGLGGTTGGSLNLDALQITTGGNASITNKLPLALAASTVGGVFNLTAPSIKTTANVSMGSGALTTSLLDNAFTISAAPGALTIQSPVEGDLTIKGGSTLSAATKLTLTSPNGNVLFAGDQTLNSNDSEISAPNGAVQVDTGVTVTSNAVNSYNISGVFFGNPGTQLVNLGVPASLVPISQTTTLGTIASPITLINPTGSINLTGSMLINSSGKNVVIIAEGDVTGAGLKAIDLSSKTGRSGSLVILAGFSFDPDPATTPLDTTTLFNNFSPSPSGGSINLAKTAINTSNGVTATSPNRAGSILMVANAGPTGGNPGSIYLGSINSSAKSGYGGKVQLFGPGGVTVNGTINTSGNIGSGAVNIAATPASSSGTILVFDGYLSPTAKFSSTGPVAGSGAAVSITGAVATNSTTGLGGAVSIVAESTIQLLKGITTSGLTGSGAVDLTSSNGNIAVSGAINTNGVSITDTKSNLSAGNGAAVTVSAPAYVSIGGISTAGGSTKGLGNGGNAAAVSVTTSKSGGYYNGNISIVGAVNASGGSGVAGKGSGGAGGAVLLQSGALQVTKTVTINGVKASVISSGGAGSTTGAHAPITIDTYAVQSVPTNFDLASAKLSEVALPGGLFTIAASSLINGTAGPVVSGSTQAKTGTFGIGAGGFNQGIVSIDVNAGASQTIDIGGALTTIQSGSTNTTRTKVTPAQALALYQVSFGNAQTLGLTPILVAGKTGGQASDTNLQSSLHPNLISIPEYDLPVAGFKTFVLSATPGTGAASDINLQITGLSPVLNISKSSPRTISGHVEFPNATTALVNTGSTALTVLAGAKLSSAGTLAFQSTGITNNGTISAGGGASPIVFIGPGKSITLTNSSTGTLIGSEVAVPANGMPTKFTFVNNNVAPTLPVSLSPIGYSTESGAFALNMLAGSAPTASSTLAFTMGASGPAQLKGVVPSLATALTVSTAKDSQKAATDLSILPGTDFHSTKALTIKSSGATSIGAAGIPQAILSANKVTIGATTTLTTTGAAISSTADLALTGTTFTDNGNSKIASTSALSIGAKTISIGVNAASNISAVSKGVKIVASAGALSVANAGTISTSTGNITLQASGAITLNSNLTAGSTGLVATPLIDSDVSKSASITLKSGSASSPGGLNIAGGLLIQAAGTTKSPGHITATVTGGDINFQGTGTTIQASGGNLVMLTTNNVVGAAGSNNFVARGIAVSAAPGAKNLGGGIEIGAGTSASKLAAATSLPSPTIPPSPGATFLGALVSINNNGGKNGVVTANASAGGVNLTTGATPATINVSKGGAVLFDALNSKTIQLNGATFTTEAYKPIAYTVGPRTRILVDKGAGKDRLANILVPDSLGMRVLSEDGKVENTDLHSRSVSRNIEDSSILAISRAIKTESARIVLLSGEMFINPLKTTIVDAGVASISIKKGALAHLSQENDLIRIIACSGPNDVIVSIGDRQLGLAPGEELVLSHQKLDRDEIMKADGIGRRFSTADLIDNQIYAIRSDVSLITLMSSLPYLNEMAHSSNSLERKITSRIFKTAAVLGQVTNYRGRYEAKSAAHEIRRPSNNDFENRFVSMGAR